MKHRPECLKWQAALQARCDAWVTRWPNYWRICNGWGVLSTPATRHEPEGHDPCDCTSEDGACPRCAMEVASAVIEDGLP
jgi:hypothetical protein